MQNLTFAQMGVHEADLEELIRRNTDVVFPGDETLLIVGQQVVNEGRGRADLVALDKASSRPVQSWVRSNWITFR